MPTRPIALSLALIVATIAAGLALRMVHLGLPGGVVKYGGSMLWAAMVYWIISTLRPHWSPLGSGVAAAVFALIVELLQLYHMPALDAFRATPAGALLLGRIFSLLDLAAYTIAIAAAALIDGAIRRHLARRSSR